MGRFNSLELSGNQRETAPEPEAPVVRGETPKGAQYFIDRGDRFFFRCEYEAALQEYSRAVGLDAGAVAAWQGQIFALTELGEYHEAELWFGNATGVVGETPELLALRALAAARTGDFERACGYSDSSLEAGGGILPHIVRGEIFLYSRRNAEYCFEQATALAGRADWRCAFLIASACLFADTAASAATALKFLLPVLEKNGARGELYLLLAKIQLKLKQRPAAQKALEECAALMNDYTIPAELKEAAVPPGFWARLFGR